MAKSKRKRKRKSKSKPPMPARMRALKQAGYQIRAFKISDDVKDTYRPGITDEIAEATILFKQGHLDEAKAAFQRIIKRDPRAKEAYSNLAAVYVQSGDEETAEKLFQEAIEKFPRYVFPRTNLAQIYLRHGRVDEAEKILRPLDKVQKFTSGEFSFYALTLSDVLAAQGDYKAALTWLRMLSKALPGSPGVRGRRVRYWIGRLFHRKR